MNKNRRQKNSDGKEVGFNHEPSYQSEQQTDAFKKVFFPIAGHFKTKTEYFSPEGYAYLQTGPRECVLAWAMWQVRQPSLATQETFSSFLL